MIGTARRGAGAGGDWVKALDAKSVLRLGQTPRALEVATFPWGDVPGKSEAFNRRWAALRRFVERAAHGEVRDPCPGARWWGGTMDPPRGRMVPARCLRETSNTFYTVAR